MKRGRAGAFWLAVGLAPLVSLTVLNVAADRMPINGLREFRDYVVRRNG